MHGVQTDLATRISWDYIRALGYRYYRLFLATFLVILVLTAFVTFTQTPVYDATTRIIIEPRTQKMLPTEDVLSPLSPGDSKVVDTEVEALHSLAIAQRTADQLELMKDKEFSGSGAGPIGVAEALLGKLSIRRAGETFLIDIMAESRSPKKAARIANNYAENYLAQLRQTKKQATDQASELLSERIAEMAGQVEQAERRVQQFKIANDLMSVNGATLAEQSIAAIDNDMARALADENAARGRYAVARGAAARSNAAQSQALEELHVKRAVALQDWQQASLVYGERHPDYTAAYERLERMDDAIRMETRRARAVLSANRQQEIDGLRAEAQAASRKRASLMSSVDQTRKALSSTNRAQVELNSLERDAQAVRATYETYLARYQETSAKAGSEQPDARIVSKAVASPFPAKPDRTMNFIFGGLLGLVTAFAAVVAKASFDTRVGSPLEIRRSLAENVLPSLPELNAILAGKMPTSSDLDPIDYLRENPESLFTGQHQKLLASLVELKGNSSGGEIIAITSALPDEGKTTSTKCLAEAARASGAKVAVVDCDMRRSVAKGPDEANNSQEIYQLVEQQILGRKGEGGSAVQKRFAELRKNYDLVFLDLPPVLPVADAALIAAHADRVLMLCRWRSTPMHALEQALQILAEQDVQIAGIALSRVDWHRQSREGYGDPAFYYDKYRDYYSVGTPVSH